MKPTVQVSLNRNKGAIQGSDTDGAKSIVKEIKGLSKLMGMQFKKEASGLGGTGILSRAIKALPGSIGALAGAAGWFGGLLSPGSEPLPGTVASDTSYEKLVDKESGEITVVETNRKTGEILRHLTEEEAIREGILTKAGELKDKYDDEVSMFDKMNEQTETWKDSYFVDIDSYLSGWNKKVKRTNEIQENINTFLEEAGVEAGKLPGLYRDAQDRIKNLDLPSRGEFEGMSTEEALELANERGYFG